MTRKATEKVLEMVEQGLLDKDQVIMACVKYMSEDQVADMAHSNEKLRFGAYLPAFLCLAVRYFWRMI